MTKSATVSKKPRKQHSPEFRSEALKFDGAHLPLPPGNSAFTSLSYIRSKLQQQKTSSEREKAGR